ncbi:MAG: hypothetical protein K9J16_14655 [Melioribacteraceae bacterium]|nr:hypothetical protein [Melioribacteraceae bacterium]MCF8356361.1 hypothetical protein [Melioribacteraceae bacterium]MCF8395800.1 hypothetical protein [Melioribacteraceae bacterium]MCF8420665.1 hypothetical protein [Melioribacteraceae bacterium]
MSRYFHPFWIGFTILITILFVLLFSAIMINELGPSQTSIFTVAGIILIWAIYFAVMQLIFAVNKRKISRKKNDSIK